MRRALGVLALLAGLASSGCGAGVISATIFGSRRGGDPVPPASITLSQPIGPLSIDADEFYVRRAVLRNAQISADADFEVRMATEVGAAIVEDEQTLLLVERSADEVSVGFALRTEQIEAAVGDPRLADVSAVLLVVVQSEGQRQEFRAPFTLLRQPTLDLVPNDPGRGVSVVSVLGDELTMSVEGLPTTDPRDLAVEVVTGDPNPPDGGPGILLRRASNLRTEADPQDPDRTILRCTVPSSSFPTQAFARAVHVTAGRSTVVSEVYYRPELTAVVSRRGVTDGGDLVSLTGQGLVPFDFTVTPPQPAFGNVRPFVIKGGREVEIGPAGLRPSLSSPNSVVFVTPPSPDGRPGPVTIRLRVTLPVQVDVDRDDLFAYGARAPDLGPRGFALDEGVVAAAYGARSSLAGPDTPVDAAVIAPDASGVPVVRVLESLGNGTFAQLGLPVRAGDRGDLDQRFPLDLVWGRFRDDPWRDVLVVNRGTARSAHTILRGRDDPSTPLRLAGVAFRSTSAPVRAHVGQFDDDPRDDVLVVGRDDPRRSTDYATLSASGVFTVRPVFSSSLVRIEASLVGDVDSDGYEDMVFAVGGPSASLFVWYGEPGPLFSDQRSYDLTGIVELTAGEVVGVHLAGPAPDHAFALVVRDGTAGAASMVLLAATGPRGYGGSVSVIPLAPAGGDPVRSLGSDLDGDGVDELVLARDVDGLSLWGWDGGTLGERPGAVGLAAAETGRVLDLDAGPAVDAARGARLAVFVAHEAPLPAGPSTRLTVLLVGPGPVLADPVATRLLVDAPRSVVLGAFSSGGASGRDLMVGFDGRLDVLRNDGVGELEFEETVGASGLVPATLVAFSALPTAEVADTAAFLLDDGRVGARARGGAVELSSSGLFDGLGTVLDSSRVEVGDVDGDGINDLVVLLCVERSPSGTIERTLQLLRGRPPGSAPFPFYLPIPAARTVIGARAVDLALGDLAPRSDDSWLEVVLSVGRDDEEMRGLHFYRLEPGVTDDEGRFVVSQVDPADPRLGLNLDPGRVRVADLDADGLDDVLVVSASLDVVQAFRQTRPSVRAPDTGEVDPLVFALSDERALPSGQPEAVHLDDFDGDGLADLALQIRSRTSPDEHEVVVAISNGLGGFTSGFEIPQPHVGSFGPDLTTSVGDMNEDGVPDLVLGWSGDGAARAPQLRVLFGTHR